MKKFNQERAAKRKQEFEEALADYVQIYRLENQSEFRYQLEYKNGWIKAINSPLWNPIRLKKLKEMTETLKGRYEVRLQKEAKKLERPAKFIGNQQSIKFIELCNNEEFDFSEAFHSRAAGVNPDKFRQWKFRKSIPESNINAIAASIMKNCELLHAAALALRTDVDDLDIDGQPFEEGKVEKIRGVGRGK